ncbi:hypothetical protein M5D96_007207 [Drosophila gunungcola]|uniref:Uncharacterized protein n=1 Tax=Drosophila gunungcola TaxID=103775 RepID=A0A9P9YMK6_9MUSC|nr:hypothetical protein M5D96_007207 [Drosophila gunungcola]
MVTAKQSVPRMNAAMLILLISMGPDALRGHLEFNNVHCLVRNRKFMDYEYCYLKSINRTYKYLSLKTKIHHLPVDNCVTRFQFRNRENRRLMYNLDFKVDACKFMRDRQNVVANWVFQTFESYSNINHTCPYDVSVSCDVLQI